MLIALGIYIWMLFVTKHCGGASEHSKKVDMTFFSSLCLFIHTSLGQKLKLRIHNYQHAFTSNANPLEGYENFWGKCAYFVYFPIEIANK